MLDSTLNDEGPTALAFFAAYSVFVEFGPRPARLITQSQWQDNQAVVEKYFRAEPRPQVMFAGSSLTTKLKFQEFGTCLFNLAVGGDSALTGLAAIVKSGDRPRKVFVEINVPRPPNDELVARASRILPRLSSVFYTENMPMNLLLGLSGWRVEKYWPTARSQNVANDAAVFQNALSLQIQGYDRPLPIHVIRPYLERLEALVISLEERGTEVVMFEMPVHPQLEASKVAAQVRSATKARLKNRFIGYEELSQGLAIKTSDGVHLRGSEAKGVVGNLEPFIKDVCFKSATTSGMSSTR